MKYRLEVSPNVHLEVARIHLYREKNQGKGTGDRFLEALSDCYKDILSNPLRYHIRKAPYRHAMLHRLKYRVVFDVEGNVVHVYRAVAKALWRVGDKSATPAGSPARSTGHEVKVK